MKRNECVPPQLAAELTPHVAIFTTPANFDHEKIRVGEFKGLVYIEVLGASDQGRLVAIWRDEQAYKAAAARFLHRVGLDQVAPMWEGFQLAILTPLKGFLTLLTPARLLAGISTLALVLGNFSTIRDIVSSAIFPPSIQASLQPTSADVVEDDPYRTEASIRNTRSLGNCSIDFAELSVTPANGIEMNPLQDALYSSVKPNERVPLSLTGKALHAGTYSLTVKGTAKAGWFWKTERPFEASAQVTVWRPYVLSPHRDKHVNTNGQLRTAVFELKVGRRYPSGLRAKAVLEPTAGIRFTSVGFPGTPNWPPPTENWSEKGKEIATIEWRTPDLPGLHVVQFNLLLESVGDVGKSDNDWEKIVQNVSCFFNEPQ